MKKAKYDIKMKNGETHTVEGYTIGDFGIDKRMVGGEDTSLSFFLTHIPTGVLVTNSKTRKTLVELVNQPDVIAETDLKKIGLATKRYFDKVGWTK